MEIREWWPGVPLEAREHLKAHLREPLDMAAQDALLGAGSLPPAAPLNAGRQPATELSLQLTDDEWTWIEQHG